MVYLPEHPCSHNGSIYLHRIVAENHLGRLLDTGEVVHHINGNKSDNRWSNLEIKTASAHSKDHAKDRPRKGETLVALLCPNCDCAFQRPKRNVKTSLVFCSYSCSTRYHNKKRLGSNEIPHGTYGRYRKGCRCELCRKANKDRIRRYRNSRR